MFIFYAAYRLWTNHKRITNRNNYNDLICHYTVASIKDCNVKSLWGKKNVLMLTAGHCRVKQLNWIIKDLILWPGRCFPLFQVLYSVHAVSLSRLGCMFKTSVMLMYLFDISNVDVLQRRIQTCCSVFFLMWSVFTSPRRTGRTSRLTVQCGFIHALCINTSPNHTLLSPASRYHNNTKVYSKCDLCSILDLFISDNLPIL